MSSELEGPVALLFPGQGAQSAEMLEPFRGGAHFSARYGRVVELLGFDPMVAAREEPEVLNRNAVSSLLTVLASLEALERLRVRTPGLSVSGYAGYSVGQLTALHAAGLLEERDLLPLVAERARLMDGAVAEAGPCGMLAVIGVRAADVAAACAEVQALGEPLHVTNDNAPGQYTLGGSEAGLRLGEERLRAFQPKRLQRVPVAGAWHSPFLRSAVAPLRGLLDAVPLGRASAPVMDNTTGEVLPEDPSLLREAVARQVAAPVQWRRGVEVLLGLGARRLIEVGWGDLLSKYGFFISRGVRHEALYPPPRSRA